MTKAELIKAILDDMDAKQDYTRAEIERRWAGWLQKQKKNDLVEILQNRQKVTSEIR